MEYLFRHNYIAKTMERVEFLIAKRRYYVTQLTPFRQLYNPRYVYERSVDESNSVEKEVILDQCGLL
jgi:hypothetical protein